MYVCMYTYTYCPSHSCDTWTSEKNTAGCVSGVSGRAQANDTWAYRVRALPTYLSREVPGAPAVAAEQQQQQQQQHVRQRVEIQWGAETNAYIVLYNGLYSTYLCKG